MKAKETVGLTTNEALGQLHRDIKLVLDEITFNKNNCFKYRKLWIHDTLHHRSQYTTICWPSIALLLISVCALLIAYNYSYCGNYNSLIFDVLLILLLLISNLGVVAWDNNLRHKEVLTRAKQILNNIEKSKETVKWNSLNYPHLCTPTSPCISLQWTYRDGIIVNLPWSLLVKGDVIVIRPGQASPGLCIPFDDNNSSPLNAHEIYCPSATTNESFSLPAARAPLENKRYVLQETPYLKNLRITLDQSLVKPISYHNKERHLIMIKCIEQTAVPILLVLTLVFNILRYLYLDAWFGNGDISEMLIVQPISVILPLLPLIFPIFWFLLNAYGMTRIKAILQQSTPTQIVDPFEDTDIGESKQPVLKFKYTELKKCFIDVLLGKGPFLTRSANILHVLGSVTALCCVDKKGILSWPNPTAEKVFFLKNSAQTNKSLESLNSECYQSTPQKTSGHGLLKNCESDDDPPDKSFLKDSSFQAVAEVLDLTHDHSTSFRLQFDDPSWKQHLSSLKPLGLAILLNTCNMATQEHYSQFCSHITCEAIHNEDLIPVTNRRCLCELAKQIGFLDQAQDIFQLEEQLCTFKHVQTDSVRKDIKFAKQLSISTKLKFPFPHMMATVVREKKSGSLQLMSQGTAEVILDSCVEYWDGHDLYPLTPADRKKILDFYQRSSLTAYCSAFAYRPLSKGVNSKLSHVYLELPVDSKHLYLPHRSPTPVAGVIDNKWKGILAQFHSTDSLLNMDIKEEEVTDVQGCFELQCNQIFIGMVTMQYQAQIDIVQLIEQLERACIRFVHFSKENELRSRVFSEKMGLESGWNCHISLLSERNRSESGHSDSWVNSSVPQRSQLSSPLSFVSNSQNKTQYPSADQEVLELNSVRANLTSSRALSFSAPSGINLELSTVKFNEEAANLDWEEDSSNPRPPCTSFVSEKRMSDDSVIVQSPEMNSHPEPWRSLSCLTDSTDQSVPVNFDIWNRAKLPRGIDNIRPHLDLIDNVPLLVSLFTDCTPLVTKEMLHIMQDYGEVVCVMGSSANSENVGIFLQADASIAIEPLYPQVCQKIPAFSVPNLSSSPSSPIELSRTLNSIACAISLRREDPFSIFQLIMEARHYTQCLMNCLQFWVCSIVALSLLQFLGVISMLPPLFSIHQILYISCAIVPILSVSLVTLPTNSQVMQKATGKNQCKINLEISLFVLWCYGSKFIPSVFIIILLYSSTMAFFCNKIAKATGTSCTLIYPNINASKLFLVNSTDDLLTEIVEPCWKGWNYFQFTFLSVQHLCAFSFVLHLATTSCSFVHRDYHVWQKLPTSNCLWLFSVMIVILMQALFSTLELFNASADLTFDNLPSITLPWFIIIIVIFSPIVIFLINESVKWQEIKVNQRFQRRKRLDFGTKLGMNSPF